MTKLSVPRSVFDVMCKHIDCTRIPKGYATCFTIDDTKYVITSGISFHGYYELSATEVVLLSDYEGPLKPLLYWAYREEVFDGKRERGYNGVIVKCDGIEMVMNGNNVSVIPIDTK